MVNSHPETDADGCPLPSPAVRRLTKPTGYLAWPPSASTPASSPPTSVTAVVPPSPRPPVQCPQLPAAARSAHDSFPSWQIEAQPGQRITLTTFDFGSPSDSAPSLGDVHGRDTAGETAVASTSGQAGREERYRADWSSAVDGHHGDPCPVLAVIEELQASGGEALGHEYGLRGRHVRLCEVRQRRTSVYTSTGSQLAVRFVANQSALTTDFRLFMQYEGGKRPTVRESRLCISMLS